MVKKSLMRLHNLLNLEIQTGRRENAFIGGVLAFRDRWLVDARADAVHPGLVQEIAGLLTLYADATTDEREHLLRTLLGLLDDPPQSDLALANIDRIGAEAELVRVAPPIDAPAPQMRVGPARAEPLPSLQANLAQPLTVLKGVGAKKAEQYARLGIKTIGDLIWHLPRRYDDFSRVRVIADVEEGERISVVANLGRFSERKFGYKKQMVQAIFNDGSGTLRASWWNQPWIKDRLEIGKTYRLSGTVGLYMGYKTLEKPIFEEIVPSDIKDGPILPIYGLTDGLRNSDVSKHVEQALTLGLAAIGDGLPQEVRQRYNLTNLPNALRQLHRPQTPEQLHAAQQRIAFNEFFYIQLGVQRRRREIQDLHAAEMIAGDDWLAAYQAGLPFTLTAAQQRVLAEIRRDLALSVPMSRLMQGDVGSGKTAVAAGAMLIAAANGYQSALLAPTQILAEQHFRGLSKLLEGVPLAANSPLEITLLTGRMSGRERAESLAALSEGRMQIAVGTTALIQEGVAFHNLGFVVVDEQHRFGVEQRAALRDKSADSTVPHLLVMSATPIPRSLAMTIYGDLDVSVLDEMPPGRMPVKTKRFLPNERERLYAFLKRQVQKGRQGYIIYPLVEESELLEGGAAVDAHARLSQEVFPDLRLGLLHGRLQGSEKDQVMRAFAGGELDVLISTSVVEVGVDVPNATVMLIEDAERFGLAQLHQFRGRVGRGEYESYCALISQTQGSGSAERLNALVETTDGFKLAEKDLELRGPGDFLGTRQSGLPDLKMASLSDTSTLALVQQAARELLDENPDLSDYPQLGTELERFWRGHGDVS